MDIIKIIKEYHPVITSIAAFIGIISYFKNPFKLIKNTNKEIRNKIKDLELNHQKPLSEFKIFEHNNKVKLILIKDWYNTTDNATKLFKSYSGTAKLIEELIALSKDIYFYKFLIIACLLIVIATLIFICNALS